MIAIKRVYEQTPAKGKKFFVERLWPRGIKKKIWNTMSGSKMSRRSPELRKWFSHDPEKFEEFRRRYYKELEPAPGSLAADSDRGAKRARPRCSTVRMTPSTIMRSR